MTDPAGSLQIRPAATCQYDAVALGEVMLRLATPPWPPRQRCSSWLVAATRGWIGRALRPGCKDRPVGDISRVEAPLLAQVTLAELIDQIRADR